MFIYTLIAPLLISLVIGGYFLVKAQKLNRVFIWEYLVLIAPIVIWNLLSLYGIGSQSLSNVVEVFILTVCIIIYSIFRYKKSELKTEKKIGVALLITVLPFVLRLFFPHLSE